MSTIKENLNAIGAAVAIAFLALGIGLATNLIGQEGEPTHEMRRVHVAPAQPMHIGGTDLHGQGRL